MNLAQPLLFRADCNLQQLCCILPWIRAIARYYASREVSTVRKLNDWFVGHVSFPVTNYLLNRRGVLASYRQMLQSEYYPEERLQEIQLSKFRDLLCHAGRFCPHYAKKLRQIGAAPEDIRSLEDVRRIPPLSRQELM